MPQTAKVRWVLELYVSERSGEFRSVQEGVEELTGHLKAGTYRVSVIVIEKHPEVLEKENIRMLPILLRRTPTPVVKIVTSFEDKAEVAEIMGISKEIPAEQLTRWRTEARAKKHNPPRKRSFDLDMLPQGERRIPSPTARDSYMGAGSSSWNLRDALILKRKR